MFSWEICQKFAENTLFSYVFATCKPHFSPSVLHDAIFLATYVPKAFPTKVEGRLQSITFCLRCRVWFYFLQRLQWIFRTSTSSSPFKGTVRINHVGGQETFQKTMFKRWPSTKSGSFIYDPAKLLNQKPMTLPLMFLDALESSTRV